MKKKKANLREHMKKVRAEAAARDVSRADGPRAARKIASQLMLLPELKGEVQRGIKAEDLDFGIISGFYPIQSEIDCLYVMKALSAAQYRLALPVMNGKKQHLAFKEWDLREELVEGSYGVMEPPSAHVFVMPDVMLVPMLAFDMQGHRLGYGGGYYDRTLKTYRQKGQDVITIGIGYDEQLCEKLPFEKHDQPLDIIVTDKKVYRP